MSNKLSEFRQKMTQAGLDAYIIHGSDAHQSEYIAKHWQTRAWFSGFTGSNGLVVVTANEAGLWTDGRYFLQAEKQLAGTGIDLYKMLEPDVPTCSEVLADKMPQNGKLGFDGRVLSMAEFDRLKKNLEHKEISYHYNEDIAGTLWEESSTEVRPPMPEGAVFAHDVKFAGKSTAEKLAEVREKMKKKHADAYIVAALDDIAWFCNMRGSDTPNTPAVFAYLFISQDKAYLFCDKPGLDFIDPKIITICPYATVFKHLNDAKGTIL